MSDFLECKEYVLKKLNDSEVIKEPFRHTYVENILPEEFYQELKEFASDCKKSTKVKTRFQDSSLYQNSKYNFIDENIKVIDIFRKVFSDNDVKEALLKKFFLVNIQNLAKELELHHDEFEFTFTEPNRFQNIHLDIPPKYLSLVFYIPNDDLTEEEELQNATIFYDKDMKPYYNAKYKNNSVGVFAQNFNSYHGNSTTVDRTAIVMFYVNKSELDDWNRDKVHDVEPYELFKDYTQKKLEKNPMIEYEGNIEKVINARKECKINAPRGRYILNN